MSDSLETPQEVLEALVVGASGSFVTLTCDQGVFVVPKEGFLDLVPGDNVLIVFENPAAPALVQQLPRKSFLARMSGDVTRGKKGAMTSAPVAANIDLGVIVASADKPAFHPRFIDRYLLLMELGNIQPVLCITKSDLGSKEAEAQTLYGSLGISIVEVSTVSGSGMEALKTLLRNKTAVFVGQSGVGKSSLVHILVPDLDIRTQEVSQKSGTGKHTTTTSGLYEWEPGSRIIDTPGIRTLSIDHIAKGELRFAFHEFDAFSSLCAFADCAHTHEPKCGVKAAVTSGEIVSARYESYLRMMEE